MITFRALSLVMLTVLVLGGATAFADAGQPGTAVKRATGNATAPLASPKGSPRAGVDRARGTSASGLEVFYRNYGKYRLSVTGAGSNDASHPIAVIKPSADAVVEKAYLMAAGNQSTTITDGLISLDGNAITWMASQVNGIPSNASFFHSVLADVTSIVKPKVDGFAGKGSVSFTLVEGGDTTKIDGEVLSVVFRVPSLADEDRRTVVLLFGGQRTTGDRFEVYFKKPFDKKSRHAAANMGLGISFGFQGTEQYSIINVNGRRLTTSAGGQDDGSESKNGALITVGGHGDKLRRPSDVNATPTNASTDDELYTLLPYLSHGDRIARIDTYNPSDDDNIFFAWFELSSLAEVNQDTDGDGLLDHWETAGYDHDGDGVIDVPLHLMGADPRRKDIFVAYAWMEKSASERYSHKPSPQVLRSVVEAYRRAPVSNPDGSQGITLHFIDRGGVPHVDDLDPVWEKFDAIMAPLVTDAERVVMHRMLNGHAHGSTTSSGLSRDIPASDFIETLGGWSSNPGTLQQRAGTIMHELGHNLGLRHGGVDHVNWKPNHLSIMNYANQVNWLIRNGRPWLDYERFDFEDIDESKVSEAAGLDLKGRDGALAPMGVRWWAKGVLRTKLRGAGANVDWNANGWSSEARTSVDLDNSGARETLKGGFVEWDNLIFDGGDIGSGPSPLAGVSRRRSLVSKPSDLDELTEEKFDEMSRAGAER